MTVILCLVSVFCLSFPLYYPFGRLWVSFCHYTKVQPWFSQIFEFHFRTSYFPPLRQKRKWRVSWCYILPLNFVTSSSKVLTKISHPSNVGRTMSGVPQNSCLSPIWKFLLMWEKIIWTSFSPLRQNRKWRVSRVSWWYVQDLIFCH